MYLSLLNEEQKKLFLKASILLSNADGNFSKVERIMLTHFCMEMNIQEPENLTVNESIEDIVMRMREIGCSRDNKIIIFELAGVVMADYVYDEKEKVMMEKIADGLDVDKEFADESLEIITDMAAMYKRIGVMINE